MISKLVKENRSIALLINISQQRKQIYKSKNVPGAVAAPLAPYMEGAAVDPSWVEELPFAPYPLEALDASGVLEATAEGLTKREGALGETKASTPEATKATLNITKANLMLVKMLCI
jgi:hypothetical protein